MYIRYRKMYRKNVQENDRKMYRKCTGKMFICQNDPDFRNANAHHFMYNHESSKTTACSFA